MSQVVVSMESQVMDPVGTTTAPVSPCTESPPFSEEERKMFRNEDYGVARLVVGIMAGVFSVGLFLYIFIACLVAMGGH